MVAREDAVSDRETGVGRDDAVVSAGDGHARPAEPKRTLVSEHRLRPADERRNGNGGDREPTRRCSRRPSRRASTSRWPESTGCSGLGWWSSRRSWNTEREEKWTALRFVSLPSKPKLVMDLLWAMGRVGLDFFV